VPTHIALLRGINLGPNKRMAMADLREAVASLGHDDVATYIQSGNVLFSSPETDTEALAAGLKQAVAERTGIEAGVVVLTRDALAKVIADNPHPDEPNPKYVHVIFLAAEPEPGHADRLAEFERQAAEKGSRDTVRLIGRAVFLHTPDGYGNSELAKLLGRASGPLSAKVAGTARNWSTVTKLLALCDG
jgi:uncharacterized protein (DUF1697 family)